MDETTADDGAIFAFWAFIEERQRRGRRPFDLDHPAGLLAAVAAFDVGDLS